MRAGRWITGVILVNGLRGEAWRAVTRGAGLRFPSPVGSVFGSVWEAVDADVEPGTVILHQALMDGLGS